MKLEKELGLNNCRRNPDDSWIPSNWKGRGEYTTIFVLFVGKVGKMWSKYTVILKKTCHPTQNTRKTKNSKIKVDLLQNYVIMKM